MILSGTTDTLELTRSSTANIDVLVEYADLNDTTKEVTVGEQESAFSTAATSAILAAPGSGLSRKVKWLSMVNRHASTACTLTLLKDVSGTDYTIDSFTLSAGERASWTPARGMIVFDSEGREKLASIIPVGQYTVARLASTVSNSTTTAAKVTGLDLLCGPGTWVFEYFLRFQSSLATTGPKLSVNHSGTVTTFLATHMFLQTNTADSAGTIDQDVTAAPTVVAGLAQRAKLATAALIGVGGVDTINLDELIIIQGLTVVTVSGNLELYHASETANATSIMLDSVLRLTKMA